MLSLKSGQKEAIVDYLDSSIRLAQSVLPPAIQYFGKAKEREAKLVQTQEELAQTKAHVEVLTIRNHEMKQSEAQVRGLVQKNQELNLTVANLEAFRNIVLVLLAVAAFVYVGMALTSESA
jgi:cell division protein FtsB